jgi:hypothetical protein
VGAEDGRTADVVANEGRTIDAPRPDELGEEPSLDDDRNVVLLGRSESPYPSRSYT